MTPDDLPANMRAKIALELPPVADVEGLCWGWQNCTNSKGYGVTSIAGKRKLAHRAAYEHLVGEIPEGLQLDHLCTNKRCCYPKHTEPVTGLVNMSRTDQARKAICTNGHRLIGDNVIIKKRGQSTVRNCRRCQADAQRRYRASKVVAA